MLVDTHAHLFWDSFKEDLDEIIKRSIEAGVTTIINVGTSVETSQVALDQIEELEKRGLTVYSSIGIHPHEASNYKSAQGTMNSGQLEEDIKKLEKIYLSSKKSLPAGRQVVAIGECGLDFNFTNPDFIPSSLSIEKLKDLQRKLLIAQINLAKKLNLPILIHCRDAWSEIFEFIKDERGILHCFSGDLEIAEKALKTDFLISFAGPITYPKNETLRKVTKNIPLEKIVLETDSPFLPPQSKRGSRNEPSSIKEIAQLIADIRGITLEKVANQTTSNFKNLFNLS